MRGVFTSSLVVIMLSQFSYAQHINGVSLDSIDAPYMELIVRGSPVLNLITIDLDYGQAPRFTNRMAALRNAADDPIQFNSVMDALAFMYKHGYELLQVYVTGESSGYLHYILKRKAMDQ